jgi:phosphate starvation-inducible protein PhoH and related proteins
LGKNKKSHHSGDAPAATSEVLFGDADDLLKVVGPGNEHLRLIEQELDVAAGIRGNRIQLQGSHRAVELATSVLRELQGLASSAVEVGPDEVTRVVSMLRDQPGARLERVLGDVVLVTARRRVITPKGLAQKAYVDALREHDLVFAIGPAGTGKTYLAMAHAVSELLSRRVKRIVLTRPAVEAGEKLGFLPGDLVEKVNPYLRPLYDALDDMLGLERGQGMIERGQIEVAPLAFMRGRTLNESFVILDEAQNTTEEQMKMFLTRLGYGSRAVVTGDVTQVDLPSGTHSGLRDAWGLLEGLEGIGFCTFTDVDVVRHPLVARIVRAYDERDARRSHAARPRADEGPGDE